MGDETRLKGVTDIDRPLFSFQLEHNLEAFFNWGFLGVGGFMDAPSGTEARLYPLQDDSRTKGRVWQGFRPDWVWETGVEYARQPIRPSGVVVDGIFRPTSGVGPYAHRIDYPQGKVVFDSVVSPSSVMTCAHSYRRIHVTTSDSPWWRQVQLDSYKADDPQFAQYGSGAWASAGKHRVTLPAVVIEAVPDTQRSPLALGGGCIAKQAVLFHVLAETTWDRQWLHDAITYQWQKRLVLFDFGAAADADRLPLDQDGSPSPSGANMYPDLIKPADQGGFGWRQLRCNEFRSASQPREVTAPLYVATVRGIFEADLP